MVEEQELNFRDKFYLFRNKLKNKMSIFLSRNKTAVNSTVINSNNETSLWSAAFDTWSEIQPFSTGYDSHFILDKCKEALLKVKNGEAVFERDSVVFDKIQYNWKLIAALQYTALSNNSELNILDFGGSLGSTYFQNKEILKGVKKIQWSIVEQEHFVKCGTNFFEEENLRFYKTVEECVDNKNPKVLLLSSVLQYLENPYEWLELFVKHFDFIIIDRSGFIDFPVDKICAQNVTEYKAKIPHWFFSMSKFEKFLHEKNREILVDDLSQFQFNNKDLNSSSKFLIIK
jgi:putative methyltransferase (TIGR04325 family)